VTPQPRPAVRQAELAEPEMSDEGWEELIAGAPPASYLKARRGRAPVGGAAMRYLVSVVVLTWGISPRLSNEAVAFERLIATGREKPLQSIRWGILRTGRLGRVPFSTP
jgi:hypothetical protein